MGADRTWNNGQQNQRVTPCANTKTVSNPNRKRPIGPASHSVDLLAVGGSWDRLLIGSVSVIRTAQKKWVPAYCQYPLLSFQSDLKPDVLNEQLVEIFIDQADSIQIINSFSDGLSGEVDFHRPRFKHVRYLSDQHALVSENQGRLHQARVFAAFDLVIATV